MGKTFDTGYLRNIIAYDASGNVGLGGAVDTTYKLKVTGAIQATGTVVGASAIFSTNQNSTISNTFSNSNTANSSSRLYFNVSAGTNRISLYSLHSDNNYINTAYGDLYFQMNASTTTTSPMIIKANGNVGIGTSSPANPLHIFSTTEPQVKIEYDSLNWTTLSHNTINYRAGDFIFKENTTERMRIKGGNVGIGTSSPNLENYGTELVLSRTSGGQQETFFSIQGSRTDDGTVGGINFYNGSNKIAYIRPFRSGADNSGSLAFYTSNAGSPAERFRITNNGDIGTGLIKGGVANYKQFNWGAAVIMGREAYDSYYCGDVYYDGNTWRKKYSGSYGNVVNWYDGQYSFQRTNIAGTADAAVTLQSNMYLDTSGNLTIRGALTQNGNPSDINLKENIVKITSALDKLVQINGYNFDWKKGSSHNNLEIPVAEGMPIPDTPISSIVCDAGLIAQEVEAIMPELIRDNGFKALNYNGITALLVEAIKELKSEIDELKNK